MDREFRLKIPNWVTLCRDHVADINKITNEILAEGHDFFTHLSLKEPSPGDCPELVFIRSIFWLQSLFHECGGRPIRFCHRQSQYQDSGARGQAFLQELRALRTHVAHNLDCASENDKTVEYTCIQWYKRACRIFPPNSSGDWAICVTTLFEDAITLLENIKAFLFFVKTSQDADLMIEDFRRSVSGQIAQYSFDEIVSNVADALGRTHLNLIKFRSDHFDRWIKDLDRLSDGYDFQKEARLLVEQSFLETPERPPVSGQDIISELEVPKGPQVGKLLLAAKQLFENGLTQKSQILEELRARMRCELL